MSSQSSSFLCDEGHAIAYARIIRDRFPEVVVSAFGDIAKIGIGRTLDLVVEVTAEQYNVFRRLCGYHGLDLITDEVIDPENVRWQSFPYKMVRTNNALSAMAFNDKKERSGWNTVDMAIAVGLPAAIIDVICVPEGWLRDPELRKRMLKGAAKGAAELMEEIVKQAKPLE